LSYNLRRQPLDLRLAGNSRPGGNGLPQSTTVCQVVHNLSVGGAELLAAGISRRLAERHRFVFACLDDRGELADRLAAEGFSVRSLSRRPGLDWRCAGQLAAFLRSENVDVVHAHQYAAFFYGALARLRGPSVPLLFTEHGRTFPDYRRWKRVVANRLLLRNQDRVVGVGEGVRQALIHHEGFRAARVSVVYNGVANATFLTTTDRIALRYELGCDENACLILHVARLDPVKDHATALRAFASLLNVFPNARLILAGDGPRRADIEKQVVELQLQHAVRLLGTRHDVPRLWAAADIALLTSTSEGIPLTLLEAMAAGLPVVATCVGGVPEIVDDGRTGLLAPVGDDAALALHLRRLADDVDLRRSMGRAGMLRVQEQFSEERMMQEYDDMYCEMANV
jgi:glycosyltransferase involved in cell wall biosynthesis